MLVTIIGLILATFLVQKNQENRVRADSAVLISDNFDGTDGTITNSEYYQSAVFPNGGTSKSTNPSTLWEGDSGSFYKQNNWGYSGRPIDWVNKYFFRFNTRNFNIADSAISWQYRSSPFGQDGYVVEGSDATDIWLRYQTQYNLYAWQFDRTNNCFQLKRKIPADSWSGPASDISNKGVYYTIPTDINQPAIGAGNYCVTWSSVANLLPTSEQSKPGYPNLAHDSITTYDFKVTAKNTLDGKFQVQAYRAGALIYSATDDGKIGIAADGKTEADHINAGYYNCCISGFQQSWLLPITNSGATGFRADNIKFWLNDFIITDLGAASLTPTPTQVLSTPIPTPTPFPPTPTPTPVSTDTTHPSVIIVSPSNGSTVSRGKTQVITANASDNVGVAKVLFYEGTTLKCTDTTYPYSCNWSVPSKPNVTYTLKAVAYDAAGNSTSSLVTVTVR